MLNGLKLWGVFFIVSGILLNGLMIWLIMLIQGNGVQSSVCVGDGMNVSVVMVNGLGCLLFNVKYKLSMVIDMNIWDIKMVIDSVLMVLVNVVLIMGSVVFVVINIFWFGFGDVDSGMVGYFFEVMLIVGDIMQQLILQVEIDVYFVVYYQG